MNKEDLELTKDLEIIKKAWKCTANINELYEIDGGVIEYANVKGNAKIASLSILGDYKLKYSDEYVKYIDVKANRCPECDIVLYNDKEVIRKTVNYFIKVAERDKELLKLLAENPNAAAYIYCGAYGSYWGPNRCGYTSKGNAGIYSITEAISLVMGGDLSRYERVEIIPIDEEKNKLKERIKELEKYG